LSLGYTDVTVVTKSVLPQQLAALATYTTIAEALAAHSFQAAFICTPTSSHITGLLPILRAGVANIYIEKPLSHNLENIDEVFALAATYKNNIVVGYDLHFDPGIQKVRSLLHDNTIGKPVSINAFVGQYLPDWRPYEDYRKGMSARKETGGGVLLDIVHEFDYLCWLIGNVHSVAGLYTNSGALGIETEEAAEVLLKFENGAIGSVHLDYLQPTLVRHFIITGTKGSITCNVSEKKLHWDTHAGTGGEFTYSNFDRNDKFKEIVKTFLENPGDERLTSMHAALQSLKIVLGAKLSSEQAYVVKLADIK
jgi:predicted dehydrogenase